MSSLIKVAGGGGTPVVPGAPTPVRPSIERMLWIAPDESRVIDLQAAPTQLLMDGVEGLHEPEVDHHTSGLAHGHGQVWHGFAAKPRRVHWRVLIEEHDGVAWHDVAREFFAAFHHDRLGTWLVQQPGQPERYLRCRLDVGSHNYSRDPVRRGHAVVPVDLVADSPWWEGPLESAWWSTSDPEVWLPVPTRTTYRIGPLRAVGSATLTNRGDVPMIPSWVVTGPATGVVIRVQDGDTVSEISGPVSVASGQTCEINPADGALLRAGSTTTDVTAAFVKWGSTRVQPGRSVDATLEVQGGGSISAWTRPLWRRGIA